MFVSIRHLTSERIILPLSDLLTGNSVYKSLKFLLKSQYWSSSDLRIFQEERLGILIRHAAASVPFYIDYFQKNHLSTEDFKKIEDLNKLPIINKSIIKRAGVENFISKNYPEKKMIRKSSSGSTGEPFTYYTSKDAYSLNIAANLRGWYWQGYRLGDRYIKISNSGRNKLKSLQDLVSNNKCIVFNNYDEEVVVGIIKRINKFKPVVLRSYVAPLLMICHYAKKHSIKLHSPSFITTTGSTLYPSMREEIQELFGAPVYDSYSCEAGANVFECPTHDCYHSSMEYAITEVIDQNTNPSKQGRLVSTDLWNFAMPFIRYDSQDVIKIGDNDCTCGRKLLCVKRILGRDTDILVASNGILIPPLAISIFMKKLPGVAEYQIRQEGIDVFIIYIKPTNEFNSGQVSLINDYWSKTFGKDSEVNIKLVDEIPLTTSGKRRYIIRSSDLQITY